MALYNLRRFSLCGTYAWQSQRGATETIAHKHHTSILKQELAFGFKNLEHLPEPPRRWVSSGQSPSALQTACSRRFSNSASRLRKLRAFPTRASGLTREAPSTDDKELSYGRQEFKGHTAPSEDFAIPRAQDDYDNSSLNDMGFAGTHFIDGNVARNMRSMNLNQHATDARSKSVLQTETADIERKIQSRGNVYEAEDDNQTTFIKTKRPPRLKTDSRYDEKRTKTKRPPLKTDSHYDEKQTKFTKTKRPLLKTNSHYDEKPKERLGWKENRGKHSTSDWNETVSSDLLEMESRPKKRQREGQARKVHKDDKKNSVEVPGAALGNDLLFGISPCLLALKQTRREVHQVYVSTAFQRSPRSEVKEITALLEERGSKVWTTNRQVLDKLCRYRPHQGISMETSRLYFNPVIEDENQTEDSSSGPAVKLVLDQIKDPMNLGALLRSAYFLGIDKVIVSKKNCCSLTPVVSKASSGVMEVMPVYATKQLSTFLQEEQAKGWTILGASLTGSEGVKEATPCQEYRRDSPIILVVGSEGFGLSDELRDLCSEFISIPAGRQLHAGIDSLNVSVATGILLHSILGRR